MLAPRRPARILGAAAALGLVVALAGCQNPADAQRISELEAQVEKLEAGDSQTASEDVPATANPDAPVPIAPAPDESVTASYPELADFDARVADLEAACGQVAPAADAQANYQTYLDMKARIDALDDEMDRYDDAQEAAARAGTVSYEDYVQIETEVDLLSDRLEHAEDAMEYTLGIYDD